MNPFIRQCMTALEAAQSGSIPVPPGTVRDFLADMRFVDADTGLADTSGNPEHALRMLAAAQYLDQLIPIATRHAPRLIMLGGVVRPGLLDNELEGHSAGSVTGSGVTMREAFLACVGEAVEYLSQIERHGDLIDGTDGAAKPDLGGYDRAVTSADHFVRAKTLASDETVLLPADLCLRRADIETPFAALSTGCGAGASLSNAILHGLLELVERDAVALWWSGGSFARPVDPADPALAAACDRLAFLRDGQHTRHAWLLNITSDLDIPCVAAVSADQDGHSVACGTAADTCLATAAERAIQEMCQMEMAYDVLDAKRRERGDAALNDADKRHLLRRTSLSAKTCALLHPRNVPAALQDEPAPDEDARLTWLTDRLQEKGHKAFVVDLTRQPPGIPTVRVFSPSLQLWPAQVETQRLQLRIAETGGGSVYTNDIPLH